MRSRWQPRSPTPPPIKHPIVDNDDESSDEDEIHYENGLFGWFYDTDAGGMTLNFGKHKGQKIHDTSISYLYWCFRTFRNNHPILEAFRVYHAGLEEHAKTAYGDFVVPFGWKHKGKKLRQCRDKQWLLWAMRQKVLTNKYTIFFIAVQHWLDNPRHYEVTRDIGESLRRSEYADGIDLSGSNEYDSEQDPTLENGRVSDEECGSGDDDEPTEEDLAFIDDGPIEDGTSSDEEELEHDGNTSSYIPTYSSETKKRQRKKKSKSRSAASRSELDREFIVPDDEEALDSEDYTTSDAEPVNDSIMPPNTRSAAKRMAKKAKHRDTSVSPTRSRPNKRNKRKSTVVCTDEDDILESNDDDDDDDEENDTLPSFTLSSHTKKASNKSVKANKQMIHDSDSELGFADIFNALNPSRESLDYVEEEEVPSPSKRSKAMVVSSPPESEGEMEEEEEEEEEEDEEQEQEEQRTRTPITPRSRFLNRKRILTSDSEGSNVAGTYAQVRSSHKKPRTLPNSSQVESESGAEVDRLPSGSGRNTSRNVKGKHNSKTLAVHSSANTPSTPRKARCHERERSSTGSGDHRRRSQYSSPSKLCRSRATE